LARQRIFLNERGIMVESVFLHTLRQAAALNRKWQQGGNPSLLGWVSMLDPAAAEVAVEWGFDALIIDAEHSTYDASTLRTTLMAFRGTDCVPIVRVGGNDQYQIKIALDLGAGGVLVPLIQNADDAREAVRACHYPPRGVRGVSPRRASNYFRDAVPYLAEADESILVMLQIECQTAYENLDDILEVQGVDCFLIGQVDLSASMNHLWDHKHPEVVQTVEDIIGRCRQAKRPVAVAAGADTRDIKYWYETGASIILTGSDLGFMKMGFSAFRAGLQRAGLM
jgi:4-hydroxy-2-oxoheptanedioate aldolase